MKIRSSGKILLAAIIAVCVLVLTGAVYFVSSLGKVGLILSPIMALLVAAVIFFTVQSRFTIIQKSADRITGFLSKTSAGKLSERIEVDEEDTFADMAKDLNVTMQNLERMSRAKNDFLSSMSHEIRTPMSAIVGMAQIAKGTTDAVKIHDCLQKIEDNSNHLIGVINDILDFSKIDSGKLILDEKQFSLKENMDFIMMMFRSKVEEKKLVLNLEMKDVDNDAVETDSLRLNQVLINLLSNAVKFTDVGGRITLSAEEIMHMNGESVYSFAVTDTGIGISSEQAVKLFSPFVQASAGTTRIYGGTGLGLVISKNIVEQMGGEIELESELGVGSTFRFTIRVKAQPKLIKADEDYELSGNVPDLHGKRILIVDDIEINREIALEILSETGATLEESVDGRAARDTYLNSAPGYYDVILMDMQMPVMDGCEATRQIRSSGRADAHSVVIIATTANVMRDDVQRVYESGMDGHIGKPIDFSEAYKVMTSLLAEKSDASKSGKIA
jgi:signal transduction histidine kinase/CheY-like chemotaxis protein